MYIIGIDEAGRGPLAGPVAVGVVLIPKNFRPKNKKTKLPLRDSKKLPEHARKAWFEYLKTHPKILCKVTMVHPKTIDRINITEAVNLAATRALRITLQPGRASPRGKQVQEITKQGCKIYLDAGIKINPNEAKSYKLKAMIRGDEKINAIKLASIAAKVTRDRYMKRKHKEYPMYGFNIHKGYGTKDHIKAIKKNGPSALHRLTFIKKYATIRK